VTSQTEQHQMEAMYRQKLEDLNQQLGGVMSRLREMETIQNEALGRLGLEKLLSISDQNEQVSIGPRGGPLISLPAGALTDKILLQHLDQATRQMREHDQTMSLMHDRWEADLGRLDLLPTALPLPGAVRLTSSFGVRADPVTHLPSMHEGVDFVAPVGTLGNTGRSTGPHLHYEVICKGHAMHPVKALAAWSQAN
jgi:murein DD-endopeptidase MepM/ murein hydrolase activator NlpD